MTQAFEEMRGGPLANRHGEDEADGLKLILLRASDEGTHQSPEFQQEISTVKSDFTARGVKADARWLTQDAVDAWCGYTGAFVVAAPFVIPAITKIIVAYLKRRTGRNVQIEFGGVRMKLKEPTEEEVDRVLTLVEKKAKKKKNS
jgi:hypothetical protein